MLLCNLSSLVQKIYGARGILSITNIFAPLYMHELKDGVKNDLKRRLIFICTAFRIFGDGEVGGLAVELFE